MDALVKDQREFEGDSGAELSEEEDEAEAAAVATAAAGGGTSVQDVARALRRCSPLMVRLHSAPHCSLRSCCPLLCCHIKQISTVHLHTALAEPLLHARRMPHSLWSHRE